MTHLRHISLTTLSLALLIGCGPSDDVVDRDPDDLDGINSGLNEEEMRNADFDIETRWTASKFIIEIYGGQGDEFYCGLAETGIDEDDGGWYEESCVESDYCHPCGTIGIELTKGAQKENLREGFETALIGDTGTTYYVERDTGSTENECWVWGDSTAYYIGELGLRCGIWAGDEAE
ncbi:MAG: hypothetical protein AAFV53_24060 [Myxococcota bacterium]